MANPAPNNGPIYGITFNTPANNPISKAFFIPKNERQIVVNVATNNISNKIPIKYLVKINLVSFKIVFVVLIYWGGVKRRIILKINLSSFNKKKVINNIEKKPAKRLPVKLIIPCAISEISLNPKIDEIFVVINC